jgi:uncharacterized integral membrane protein (TIGR00698 family)
MQNPPGQPVSSITSIADRGMEQARVIFPGVLVALLVALAAQFLSDHYGAPAMLMALLLGVPLHFLSEEGKCVPGIAFSVSFILRAGVALLGVRVSVELISTIGFEYIGLTIAGVFATILFGLLGARLLGRGWRLGLLTGGSVAICGASAAIAISAVLPKNEHSERNLIFTVLSVTLLSTLAMIIYPPLAKLAGMSEVETGVFLGATIHDVAQVVGAGFSSSAATGEIATVVKLVRVSMLAPVVLLIVLLVHRRVGAPAAGADKPSLLPGFVLGFVALALIRSTGLLPAALVELINDISGWALLVAIAAVGMRTSLQKIMQVGGQAIVLIVAETIFIAGLIASIILSIG